MQRISLVVAAMGLAVVAAVAVARWTRPAEEEPSRPNPRSQAEQMRDLAAILEAQGKGDVARQLLDDAAALAQPGEQTGAASPSTEPWMGPRPSGSEAAGAPDPAWGDPAPDGLDGPVFTRRPQRGDCEPPVSAEENSLRREMAELREQLRRLAEDNAELRRRIESLEASLSESDEGPR
jgi:hypothetical protein